MKAKEIGVCVVPAIRVGVPSLMTVRRPVELELGIESDIDAARAGNGRLLCQTANRERHDHAAPHSRKTRNCDESMPVHGRLVHHSDQGNQCRASLYQMVLARRGVVVSMSRKGNCHDNAPVKASSVR
jgi:hypothetical protein